MPRNALFNLSSSAIVCFILTGCQTYNPQPLDLEEHATAWRQRTPQNEQVTAFARRLNEMSSHPLMSFDPSDGLSLQEAEVVALVFNPDLRLARLRSGVARAIADHSGSWDDPEIGIDLLRIIESVPDPWVVGSAISFTFPLSGRLKIEKERARSALHAELERIAEEEWRIKRDLREAWLNWSALQLKFEETSTLLVALDEIIQSTTKQASAGELPRTEAALFAIEHAGRQAELGDLKGDIQQREQEIRQLIGLSPDASLQWIPDLSIQVPNINRENVAENNPSLVRLRREYEVAEHTLHREIREQYPDLTIGPQYENDEGQSRVGFLGAIPVPVVNGNREGIAEAAAQRDLARGTLETAYERIMGQLSAQRYRLETIHAQQATVEETLLPLVDQQMSAARRLVELGEGGSLILLESLVRAHDARIQVIDSQLKKTQTLSEILFLLGPPISQSTSHQDEVKP